MNIKQFVEFLQTIPQDATVQVLSHFSEHSLYMQGGSCRIVDFTAECRDSNKGPYWMYGEHFELESRDGQFILQLGVMDK